jgi:hypothetical protein
MSKSEVGIRPASSTSITELLYLLGRFSISSMVLASVFDSIPVSFSSCTAAFLAIVEPFVSAGEEPKLFAAV